MKAFIFLCALLALEGCASVASGTSEAVNVNTTPPGAVCVLDREGVVVGQVYAPGSVQVSKSRHDMVIHCNKHGYEETDAPCHSGMTAWVGGNVLFGLIGGPVGIITDLSTGAVNDYDDVVNVVLVPRSADDAASVFAHYPHLTMN